MYTCSILAVGDELLDGRVADTNSDFMTEALASIGLPVRLRVIVGDGLREISAAVSWLMTLSDAVIVSGGLGPTSDDLTREAVAESLGLSLVRDAGLEEKQRAFFAAMGREMSPTNLKQADLIAGADPLGPRLGTAPGQWIEEEGVVIALVPGVPREMREMVEVDVIPRLSSRFSLRGGERAVSLLVAAKPESEVAESVDGAVSGYEGISVSYRAMLGQIEVRISAREEGRGGLEEAAERARRALGPWVVAEGGESLEGNLGEELRRRGLTLAAAESCTGGMVGERITRVPGSSAYFQGGVVAYTHAAKVSMLGIDAGVLEKKGAVNEEVAEAMARGVRERLRADIGMAVTGLAGPDDGGEGEAVGTVVFAISGPAGTFAWKYRLPGDRDMVRQFAATALLAIALFYVRGEGEASVR